MEFGQLDSLGHYIRSTVVATRIETVLENLRGVNA
jgi:hypothetical protein